MVPPQSGDSLAPLVLETLRISLDAESVEQFWTQSLGAALRPLKCRGAAIALAVQGAWVCIAHAGREPTLPTDLLAEALDTQRAVASTSQWVEPLFGGYVLVLDVGTSRGAPPAGEAFCTWAEALSLAGQSMAQRAHHQRRLSRLEAIVEVTTTWSRTRQTEPLLEQMAAAAARLLDADRATVFLWDKGTRTLVGRPALGVSKGELRVSDDTGLVGEVLRSGRAARLVLTGRDTAEQVQRRIDATTGYATRSLVAVPLRGSSGELFGVFEVVNKRRGSFTEEDEADLAELSAFAALALENTWHWEELAWANQRISDEAAARVRMVGDSPPMRALRDTLQRVAKTDLPVLVLGENGTGKEIVAQSIHFLGPRRRRPFIAVNCAGIPETLLESELFGHEKGAFTGADISRAGKFELAAEGTLFLDEIGDMSLAGQAKLLRVLEEKTVVRIGGTTPIATDTRIIAATNQDLAELVRQKKFRQDLFFRLNVVSIPIVPLRERGDDVLVLADYFLGEFSRRARRKPPRLTAAARNRLLAHPWPGNVRELRNLMERLAYLSTEDKIDAADLPLATASRSDGASGIELGQTLSEATERFQTDYIQRTVRAARGNISAAAERLGLQRSNFYRKLRQLGLSADDVG